MGYVEKKSYCKVLRCVMAFMAMALAVLFFIIPAENAYAYESWVRDKESGPTVTTTVDGDTQAEVQTDLNETIPNPQDDVVGSVEKRISETIMSINLTITKAMREGKTDISATGIILSHLTSSDGTSFFVFDLTDTNIYGIIGATLYAALRTISLGFLFIVVLYKLIFTLYEGDVKGLANMKEVLYSALIAMLLLFVMPQIVDWVCTARNAVGVFLYNRIGDVGLGEVQTYEVTEKTIIPGHPIITELTARKTAYAFTGMELTYYKNWEAKQTIINALVYTMACVVVPLVYMFSYIKIAIMEMVLFGLYPAFAILGVRDKNIGVKWSAIFFSNVFVPVIDLCVLYIPAKAMELFEREGSFGLVVKALIVAAIYMSAVTIRNKVLELVGNTWGVRPNVAGALALGAAAASGVKNLLGGGMEALGGVGGLGTKGGGDAAAAMDESDRSMAEMAKQLDPIGGAGDKADENSGAMGENKPLDPIGGAGDKADENSERPGEEQGDYRSDRAGEALNGENDERNSETDENKASTDEEAEHASQMNEESTRAEEDIPHLSESGQDSGDSVPNPGDVPNPGENSNPNPTDDALHPQFEEFGKEGSGWRYEETEDGKGQYTADDGSVYTVSESGWGYRDANGNEYLTAAGEEGYLVQDGKLLDEQGNEQGVYMSEEEARDYMAFSAETGQGLEEWMAQKESEAPGDGGGTKTDTSSEEMNQRAQGTGDGPGPAPEDANTSAKTSDEGNKMESDVHKDVTKNVETSGRHADKGAVSAEDIRARAAKDSKELTDADRRAKTVMAASASMDKRVSGKNAGKYQNFNASRLANLETLGNLRQREAAYTHNINSAQRSAKEARLAIQANDARIAALPNLNKEGKTLSAAERVKVSAEEKRLGAENKALQQRYADQLGIVEANTVNRNAIQGLIAQYSEREAQFASASADAGMSNKVYMDAGSFAKDMERAQRARQVANLKNFNTEGVKGFMTPEDRIAFERQESIRQIGKGLGTMAGAAVGMAATGVTAFVSAPLGEEAPGMVISNYSKTMIGGAADIGRKIGGHDLTASAVGGVVAGAKTDATHLGHAAKNAASYANSASYNSYLSNHSPKPSHGELPFAGGARILSMKNDEWMAAYEEKGKSYVHEEANKAWKASTMGQARDVAREYLKQYERAGGEKRSDEDAQKWEQTSEAKAMRDKIESLNPGVNPGVWWNEAMRGLF